MDAKFEPMCLSINQGGMGIQRSTDVCTGAYAASVMTWMKSASFKRFSELHNRSMNHLLNSLLPRWSQFWFILSGFENSHPDTATATPPLALPLLSSSSSSSSSLTHLRPASLLEFLKQKLAVKLEHRETLQSHLCQIIESRRIKDMKDNMGLMELEWWQNQCNATSGQPLLAFPSSEAYKIPSSNFRTYLKHRYLLPMDFANCRCDCKRQPSLDPYGIHFTCGCNIDGLRSRIHDAMLLELQRLLKYCGFATQREHRNLLSHDTQHRTDITIHNPAELGFLFTVSKSGSPKPPPDKAVVDLSFTSVIDGAGNGTLTPANSRQQALKVGSKCSARYNEKYKKYHGLLEKLRLTTPGVYIPNYWILPCVFHTTGYLHGKFIDLLERMARAASAIKRIPQSNLLTYFTRRLSCCLANNVASSINERGARVMSHSDFNCDRSFDPMYIMEPQVVV